jgi:dolichol-phosphate mannosyltransferase
MTASSDCFVSVVAPLHNDADILEAFLADLTTVIRTTYRNYEIVLVDDGSSDNTIQCAVDLLGQHPYVRLIELSRSFGEEVAITAGLDSVIGDYVVVLIPEFEVVLIPEFDPPELIPEMVERARRNQANVLGVDREARRRASWWLRLGSALFHRYANGVLHLRLNRDSTHFRVMSREAVNAIIRIKDRLRHMRVFTAYVGFAAEEFPYNQISRRDRTRRRGLFEAIELAVNIVVANSTQPLRVVALLGLLVSALNGLYVGYVLATYFLTRNVAEGWATRSIQTSVMFFFMFLVLAVLCEYAGRILSESQNRPLYYVLGERASSGILLDSERKNVVTHSANE